MGKKYTEIGGKHQAFIAQQKLFFVATAACEGRINLSPKGMDSLRVLDPNRVLWLNLTGSGNETAAHLLENDRMTLMFCAFEGAPKILRLYGRARAVHPRDADWNHLLVHFSAIPGARQLIDMEVDLVHSSCGFGVPLYDYAGERKELIAWTEAKEKNGLSRYWQEQNSISLDGKPTGISDQEGPD